MSLNSLIFHRKLNFQSNSNEVAFCDVFKYFVMMLHPLFELKYRFDPTLPRVYKFMAIYTRIIIIFGLSFYFLRNFKNFELIVTKPSNIMLNDFLFLGVSLVVCSCILIPLPVFLYCCCRSRYYLAQPEKLTEAGSRED